MKIVYCIDSVGSGGVEQITVVKANALADKEGYLVWILYTDSPSPGGFHHPSEKVIQIDLGIRYRDNQLKFPWNIFADFKKRRRHLQSLALVLKTLQPDIVISTGQKEHLFLPWVKGEWVSLRELHRLKGWRARNAHSFRDRVIALIQDHVEFDVSLRRYDCIVAQTEAEIENEWKTNNKVVAIPNPTRFLDPGQNNYGSKRIVAAGRLIPGKNYCSLIRVFHIVSKRFPDWELTIVGDGEEKKTLEEMVEALGLSDKVSISDYSSDLRPYFENASIFAHTSLIESFGLVIVEAMSMGLPVVAYDCPYGPRSIIRDGVDGYLIPIGDEKAMADRICRLIIDEELRKRMGSSALMRSRDYSVERICNMWESLFDQLKSKS